MRQSVKNSRKSHNPPVLIARTDNLGDFVQSLPAVHLLAAKLGENCAVMCSNPQQQLLRHDPLVKRIIVADRKNPEKTAEEIRKQGFGTLVSLVNDSTMKTLLPLLKFIPQRIGNLNSLAAWWHYNTPVRQKRAASLRNEAEYNLDLLKEIGLQTSSPPKPRIYLTVEELDKAVRRLKVLRVPATGNVVAVHPGMKGSALNWGRENYLDLIRILLREGANVVLTGGNLAEWEYNEGLAKEIHASRERLHNLANLFDLRIFAAVLAKIGHMLAPSTGVLHLAGAVGCNITGIYPPIKSQSPIRWQPFRNEGRMFSPQVNCPAKFKCLSEQCPHFDCMQKIKPETLAAEILGRMS